MLGKLFDRAIEQGVQRAANDYLASPKFAAQVDGVIDRILADLAKEPRFIFIKHMARRYLERSPKLTTGQAWDHARDWLNDFLRGEKAEFGDPRYDWSREGARVLADEDIQYWEVAA